MIRKIGAILWKDLITEFRSKEMVFSMLVFSLMVAVIFNFSFPPGSEFIAEAVPGILWMTFVFASLLGMSRSFVREVDRGCLHGLMLAPVDRAAIYISKALINFLFILMVEVVALPLFAIFFKIDVLDCFWPLSAILLLGTLGFAVVGTLFSAISVGTRTREVMLPILHFPVSIPLIICAVQASKAAIGGEEWQVVWDWLKIILVFDLIFLIVGYLTFEYVVEDS